MSVLLQNFKYDNINLDIYNRNIPSHKIAVHYDPRPVNTKYRHLPILDPKQQGYYEYNPSYSTDIFFPATRKPHYDGYCNNIDKESSLRNQFFALQKGDQHLYVPSSNSDMYYNPIDIKTHDDDLNRLGVFYKESFNEFNPNISNKIGKNIFNNNTRVQLKNIL